MRKTFLTAVVSFMIAASGAFAGVITISPPDPLPGSLDHFSANKGLGSMFTNIQAPTIFFGDAKFSLIAFFSGQNDCRAGNDHSFALDVDCVRHFAGNNGLIWFRFDPDRHYNNKGDRRPVNVPEPSTAGLLSMGIFFLVPAALAFRRKRFLKEDE
jgi:hypothetical protein